MTTSASGKKRLSGEKEFLLHEYERIVVFAIRPSTVRTLLSPELSPASISSEPEFKVESSEYGYIENFIRQLRDSGERVSCDDRQNPIWVAKIYRENGEVALLSGNEKYYVSAEGGCFRLSGITLSSLVAD